MPRRGDSRGNLEAHIAFEECHQIFALCEAGQQLLGQGAGQMALGYGAALCAVGQRQNIVIEIHGHAVLFHHFAQRQRGIEVVSVIHERLGHRFADSLESGKVNDCLNFFGSKQLVHCLAVSDVGFISLDLLTGNLLHTAQRLILAVDIIIHNNHFISGIEKLHTGMGTDISCTARQQYAHL